MTHVMTKSLLRKLDKSKKKKYYLTISWQLFLTYRCSYVISSSRILNVLSLPRASPIHWRSQPTIRTREELWSGMGNIGRLHCSYTFSNQSQRYLSTAVIAATKNLEERWHSSLHQGPHRCSKSCNFGDKLLSDRKHWNRGIAAKSLAQSNVFTTGSLSWFKAVGGRGK